MLTTFPQCVNMPATVGQIHNILSLIDSTHSTQIDALWEGNECSLILFTKLVFVKRDIIPVSRQG